MFPAKREGAESRRVKGWGGVSAAAFPLLVATVCLRWTGSSHASGVNHCSEYPATALSAGVANSTTLNLARA